MQRQFWSGSKPFDAVIVLLKDFLKKGYFDEKRADNDERMEKYLACKELTIWPWGY